MIDFILNNNKYQIFIACPSKIIKDILCFIRLNKISTLKIQMICE